MAQQYAKVMQVFFIDGTMEMFDLEIEPVIKEFVTRHRRSRKEDPHITAYTITGDTIRFNCSDVLHFGDAETSSPEFHLMYPSHVRMVEFRGQLLYVVNEDYILGVVR